MFDPLINHVTLGVGVGEAHDEVGGAVGEGHAARLEGRVMGRGRGSVESGAVDKVVVLEGAVGLVLDGDYLGLCVC